VPAKFGNMMIEAYYGGHFEISRTGYIGQPVWEYDINSAYPAAMSGLPCALHTAWQKVPHPGPGLYCAEIEFAHNETNLWAGFPFRTQSGHLYWPLAGSGVYWSPEIEAAQSLGAEVKFREVWQAVKCCDCKPYSFVEPLYEFRKSLGKGNEGYPIKLGLNAMYGKLAQRKGAQRYYNLIHAGLITAITRAKLLSAVAHNPEAVIMLATDAVYSLAPLPLPVSKQLGDWEAKERPDMFIVQPGLYWFPGAQGAEQSHKTRGIPKSVVEANADKFRKAWELFARSGWLFPEIDAVGDQYNVALPLNSFIGIRLAMARNKPHLAGCWKTVKKKMSFDWRNKRGVGRWSADYQFVQHWPIKGSAALRSAPYDASKLTELDGQHLELEANPDFLEFISRD
jgi:DNA polymerase type B, organellar and viral